MNFRALFNPFDVIEENSISINELSPELRIIMKKISKSDILSKQKGIEELIDWIKGPPKEEQVRAILPQYVTIFSENCVSVEKSIRLSTFKTLGEIINLDKKMLLPVINDLIFPWLGALCDASPPVSSLATNLLNLCFPPQKASLLASKFAESIFDQTFAVITDPGNITSKSNKDLMIQSSIRVSNAFIAAAYICENIQSDDAQRYVRMYLFSQWEIWIGSINVKDPTIRSSLYLFAGRASHKNLLPSDLGIRLKDLATCDLSTAATSNALDFLAVTVLTEAEKASFCKNFGKNFALNFPLSALISFDRLLSSQSPSDQLALILIMFESLKQERILDQNRLCTLWLTLIRSIDIFERDECRNAQRENVFGYLFSEFPGFKDLYPSLLPSLINAKGRQAFNFLFEGEFDIFEMPEIRRDVLLSSIPSSAFVENPVALTKAFDLLKPPMQYEIIRDINSENIEFDDAIAVVSRYYVTLARTTSPISFASKLTCLISEKPSFMARILLDVLGLCHNPEIKCKIFEELHKYGITTASLEEFLNDELFLWIQSRGEQFKLESLSVSLAILAKRYFRSPGHVKINYLAITKDGLEGDIIAETLMLLSKYHDGAISLDAFVSYCYLNQYLLVEEDFNLPLDAISALFENIQSPVVIDALRDSLLKGDDSQFLGNILKTLLSHTDALFRDMETHISKSIAILSFPSLLSSEAVDINSLFIWPPGDNPIKSLKAAISLLPHAITHSCNEPFLKAATILLTFNRVFAIEADYIKIEDYDVGAGMTNDSDNENMTALSKALKGFDENSSLIRGLNLCDNNLRWCLTNILGSFSNGDLVSLPLEACSFVDHIFTLGEIKGLFIEDVEWDVIEKILLCGCEVDKDIVYIMFARIPAVLLSAQGFSPRDVYILSYLFHKASLVSLKNEYWLAQKPLLQKVINAIFADKDSIIMNHLAATLLLKSLVRLREYETLDDLKTEVCIQIWKFSKEISLAHRQSIVDVCLVNVSCQLLKLNADLVRSSTPADELIDTILKGKIPSVLSLGRTVLSKEIDLFLENANNFLPGKESNDDGLSDSAPLPWARLTEGLRISDRSLHEKLVAMDLFLNVVEGASENYRLFSLFSKYFSDFLAEVYLNMILHLLGLSDRDHGNEIDLSSVEISTFDYDSFQDVIEMVPNILFRLLKAFPSVIRKWYEQAPSQIANSFLRCCQNFYSPLLVSRELRRIRVASIPPLALRVEKTSTTCSVAVDYHLDDFSLKYFLSIPSEYPLKPISVQGVERLGISESKWRAWLLSIQSLLNQNLSIVEVIRKWKVDAEKTLQGFEPCSICYCVLQPGDRTLPGPSCKTCCNKFHSACLYKWFKTGGQATCPMCRSLF